MRGVVRVSFFENIKNKIWLKLKSLKGSPYAIASGAACGVAISFTPFVGLHLVLAMLWALLVRGSVLAAAVGTIIGNPWTFPFIWLAIFYTGRLFLGLENINVPPVDFVPFFQKAFRALMHFDFDLFFQDIWPILKPMIIGCIPYVSVVWLLTYVLLRRMLEKRR